MNKIKMVDLNGQYHRLKLEIDTAIHQVLNSSQFIGGPIVQQFESSLAKYLDCRHVVGCANGTDALQIALMSLNLEAGDEIIIPSFTYVSTVEVIALLGLTPVMVDVDKDHFNCTAHAIEQAITKKTKAIIPVHLFGQSSPMEDIMTIAQRYQLYVIEDNAQSIGASHYHADGSSKKTGTIGHIGCVSFFPTKNLACFGDGGAIITNDDHLAKRIRMIAKHGQQIKYHHELVGCNSRLDAIQAAVLNVKLSHLDSFLLKRQVAAQCYDTLFSDIKSVIIPKRISSSYHVINQYTICVLDGQRDQLKKYLNSVGIESAIYYPIPLYKQLAFNHYGECVHPNSESLCKTVLSLPMHTELNRDIQTRIVKEIKAFFKV
jgi:dTDP-4-amino-4,6-dideoxygalactose transaminase